jgi:DNA-binding transcriptional ArsR family regulator
MDNRPAHPSRMPKKRRVGPGAPPLDASVAAMRALAHPLRLRMFQFMAESPRTIKQVAETLDQPPTRLYHHVTALERAGLIRVHRTRRVGGNVEKSYESITRAGSTPVRRANRSVPVAARASERSAKCALAAVVLEQLRQEVLHAIADPVAEPPLLARLVIAAPRAHGPVIQQRVIELLTQLKTEFAAGGAAPQECLRWMITLTLAPVPSRGA